MVSPVVDRGVAGSGVPLPSPPEWFVSRERLRARVEDAAGNAALTTLCAPAGTGKTVLLTAWARSTSAMTAWVTVDPADNRPGRLWTAVSRAVVARVPALAAGLCPAGAANQEPETGPGPLLAALDALPTVLHLVLDDLHRLSDPARLDELRTLIRYRPDRLRLIMAGRTLPALPWPRLRLTGGVADLDGHDLAFTPGEAASLLSRLGARTSPADLADLLATTGGWAAALRLAAETAPRSTDGPASPTTRLTTRTAIASYLEEHVLGPLPDGDRSLLRDLAVRDTVSADLARDLSGRPDAAPALERLAQQTSLVDVDPHGGFRVHSVLRSSVDDARRTHLHVRAARWCATRGRPDEALEHARSAGDQALLRELIEAWALPLLLDGEHDVLRRACEALDATPHVGPVHLVRAALAEQHPVPGTALGEADLDALRTLADLGAASTDLPDGDDGRSRRARTDAAETVDAVMDGVTKLVVLDDPAGAGRVLAGAATRCRDLGHHHLALRCTALLAASCAALDDAAGMAGHGASAVALATHGGWETSVWAISARATGAHGALLRGRQAEARRQATSVPGDDALHPASAFFLRVVGGAALADSGHLPRGLAEMQQARAALSDRQVPAREAAVAAVLEQEAALRLDRVHHAYAVCRWLDTRVGPTGEGLLMAVRDAVRADPSTPVAQRLRPILDGSRPALLADTEVEALLLGAGEARLARHDTQARALVMAALDRAAPLDLIRPFTHTSAAVRELMAYQVGSFGATDPFARRALASGRSGPAGLPGVVLSDRESTILRLLPSLATTTEIAEDLRVSLNTVKTQVAAIYGKLGVSDRRAAVSLAYDAGLLDDITRSG